MELRDNNQLEEEERCRGVLHPYSSQELKSSYKQRERSRLWGLSLRP